MKNQSFLHALFATEINVNLHLLNSKRQDPSSVRETIHRAWLNFGSSRNITTDKFILRKCFRGEKLCIKDYEERFKNTSSPSYYKSIPAGQPEGLRKNIDGIKNLDDLS